MMKKQFCTNCLIICLASILMLSCRSKKISPDFNALKYPKREFRGAWLQTAWQERYKQMDSDQIRQYFVSVLDQLHAAGINALIFQVRPQADAFYSSSIEPWSIFMTGVQGRGFKDGFDPLAFLVDEAHKRNMELHAWLNPYRVKLTENQILASDHLYYRRPELFVKYGNQVFFDPGIPENRSYVCKVVEDIVKRYDVDAIHMDDYFYPYPVAGVSFPDDHTFRAYGLPQGFTLKDKNDWRRNNVNMLIKEIKETIMLSKPWVRFGISPFGIYRNKKSTADGSGSETNGLQNYDDLYVDVKLWAQNKWIDYTIPQIYWEIGHKSADYTTLLHWWSDNNFSQPLYIGQDVTRTMQAKMPSGDNQLFEKLRLERSMENVSGHSFWSGYNLVENFGGVTTELIRSYHKYPALIPSYSHMSKIKPKRVKNLKNVYTPTSHYLQWKFDGDKSNPHDARYFVIYRFKKGQKYNIEDPRNIVGITSQTVYELPYEGGKQKYDYVVTSVNAYHNESVGSIKSLTL